MVFARRVADLIRFRGGPQNMPGDQSTLVASALAYCIAQVLQIALIASAAAALVQAVLATVVLGLYAGAVLRMRQLGNRFNQTATALFASGAAMTVLMLAPTYALAPYIESLRVANDASQVAMPSPLAALAYLIIGVWGLAICAHIYRHALDVPIALGVAVTIGFEVVVLIVFSLLG